mmetsp:Transcript_50072/g.150704  ORF Transcript_50072/g.150704 Transcript_50072/m.150704 type:complete len:710 (-) Transcript_50072:196-2325(-)
MAGTRLLVHSVFLVGIFGLALVSWIVGSLHPDHVGFLGGGNGAGMFVDRSGTMHISAAERALEGAERMGRCDRAREGKKHNGGGDNDGAASGRGKVLLRLWEVTSASVEEECLAAEAEGSCPSSSSHSSEETIRTVWETINSSQERRIRSGKRPIAVSLDSADERTRLGRRLATISSSSDATAACDDLTPQDVVKLGTPEGWVSRHDYDEFSVDYRDLEPIEVLVVWGCAVTGIRADVDGETGAMLVKVEGDPPAGAEGDKAQVKRIAEVLEGLVDGLHLASASPDQAGSSQPPPSPCRLTVTAIDEDPSSWNSRSHHAEIGRALRSSYYSTLRPLLESVSAYGIAGEWKANLRTAAYGSLSAGCHTIGRGQGGGYKANAERVEAFAREHEEILSEPRRFGAGDREDCGLDLVVYVPSRTNSPLRVKDAEAKKDAEAYRSAFAMTDEWGREAAVAIANPTVIARAPGSSNVTLNDENDSSRRQEATIEYDEAIREAMSYLTAHVAKRMGMPPLSSVSQPPTRKDVPTNSGQSVQAIVHPAPPGALPRSLRDALLESRRDALFSVALSDLRTALGIARSYHRTGLPPPSGRRLEECAELLLSASSSSSRDGTSASTMRDLERAARLAREALEDGDAAEEHLYFPREHYVAVFSPLLLPLVLPLLVGLVREWKRYKKLVSPGKEEGKEEVVGDGGAEKDEAGGDREKAKEE